tara:strand:+ start:3194 stop:3436 length:243 start_codon:yes stop_codon:yes gene_type:complete
MKTTYKAHYVDGTTKIFTYEEKPKLEHLYEIIGTDIVEPLPGGKNKWFVDEEASFKKGVKYNIYVDCLGTAVELIDCELD